MAPAALVQQEIEILRPQISFTVTLSTTLNLSTHRAVSCSIYHLIVSNEREMQAKYKSASGKRFVYWPKRAINKILFSQFINKPQEVCGFLPQHLKHLILAVHKDMRPI